MMSSNLVDLCLDSIVNHFTGYNLLFTTSDDFYVKKILEFLQRKYSFDLLSRLHEKENLPEEFIDVLVNKYVKSLNTSWLTRCSWDKILSKMAEIGCNLEKIFFDHDYCGVFCEEPPLQDMIRHLTNLKSFTFHYECDDLILKNVAEFCCNIEEIDVKESSVTSDGARHLCRNENEKVVLTQLKKLRFGKNKSINAQDLDYLLKNFPSLEVLDHSLLPFMLYYLHINDLPSIDKVKPHNITELNMKKYTSDEYDDIIKVCVSVCPNLKYFTCFLTNEEELNYLFNLSDLEQLNIEYWLSLYKLDIDSLLISIGGKLTSLTIVNCTVSVSVLAESCLWVKELTLNNVNILGDDDSKPIFNSLSSLTFIENPHDSSMTEDDINLVLSSSLFKLESLSFENCRSFPELNEAILKCCESYAIKQISFCKCDIEKEFVKELLSNSHTLTYLDICECQCFKNREKEKEKLLKFAEILPNKPKIFITDYLYKEIESSSDDYEFINILSDSYCCSGSDSDSFSEDDEW